MLFASNTVTENILSASKRTDKEANDGSRVWTIKWFCILCSGIALHMDWLWQKCYYIIKNHLNKPSRIKEDFCSQFSVKNEKHLEKDLNKIF